MPLRFSCPKRAAIVEAEAKRQLVPFHAMSYESAIAVSSRATLLRSAAWKLESVWDRIGGEREMHVDAMDVE